MLTIPQQLNDENKLQINVDLSYPNHKDYEFFTSLPFINLDDECKSDIESGKGFRIIGESNIKKEIVNPDGLFSSRFGLSLKDANEYINRYKCKCGKTTGKLYEGQICPYCKTHVIYLGDDFSIFGWIILDNYYFIHPSIYQKIDKFFGTVSKRGRNQSKGGIQKKESRLSNILSFDNKEINKDGFIDDSVNDDSEPFKGIGMIEFKERFDEIMKYYVTGAAPTKKKYYDEIMEHRDIVFQHSFPVFTSLLRLIDIKPGKDSKSLYYENTNKDYMVLEKTIGTINKIKSTKKGGISALNLNKINSHLKIIQDTISDLMVEILNILNGKKGQLELLVSGRYSLSGRAVIISDPSLDVDQLILPYTMMCTLLEPKIINILHRMYNLPIHEAMLELQRGKNKYSDTIAEIIRSLIKNTGNGEGIPVLFNRNPTIEYGSILQMYVVGFEDSFPIKIPLEILELLAGDFDGDALNVFSIINDTFHMRLKDVFNPKYAMQISHNDGFYNTKVSIYREAIINMEAFTQLSRKAYSDAEIDNLSKLSCCY